MVFERDFRFSYHLVEDPSCWRGQRLHVTSPPSYGTSSTTLLSLSFWPVPPYLILLSADHCESIVNGMSKKKIKITTKISLKMDSMSR